MADYEFQVARYDNGIIYPNRQLARQYLNTFDRHLYGQFVAVKYYNGEYWPDGNKKFQIMLAMGVRDWNSQAVGDPHVGEMMYVIIADTGDDGGGGGGGGSSWNSTSRVFKIDEYYTTPYDVDPNVPEIPTPLTFDDFDTLDAATASQYIYNTIYRKVLSMDFEDYDRRDGDLCVLEFQATLDFPRTCYVTYVYDYNADLWMRQDVVADTSVIFVEGVQRTEAIGAHPATSLVTEGRGMTLKQLLEYYLVQSRWPEHIAASWNVPDIGSEFDVAFTNSYPNLALRDITLTNNKALVEVGTEVWIQNAGYSWIPNINITCHQPYTCGPATVSGAEYGAVPVEGYSIYDASSHTLIGTDSASLPATVTDNINRTVQITMGISYNAALLQTISSSVSTPETSSSMPCTIGSALITNHGMSGSESREGTYNISLSMISQGYTWIESWGSVGFIGVGAGALYKNNTGDTRECSTLIPNVTGSYTVNAGSVSKTLASDEGYASYNIISLYPLFTNGKHAEKVDYKAYDQDIDHNPHYSSNYKGWCAGGAASTSAATLTR